MPSRVPIAQLMACLEGRPPENIDWAEVIAVTNRTLTTGTLAQRQQVYGPMALPQDVRDFLTAIDERALERARRMRDQLTEAVNCLNRADIMPMLIKGAALLAMPGLDARGRILSDLDIMVPPSALVRAGEALGAIGYVRQTQSSDATVAHIFARSQDAGTIDLHYRLKVPRPRFDVARLASYCNSIAVGSGKALLPSTTAQALILVLHDQLKDRDYWRGLIDMRHVLDIAALARAPEGINWNLLDSWFPERQPRSALRTQLVTVEALVGVGVPPRLIKGWWPRLQHSRRIIQTDWPVLGPIFTLLTLALDPPRYGWEAVDVVNGVAAGGIRTGSSIFARAFSGLKRIHRSKAPGKL